MSAHCKTYRLQSSWISSKNNGCWTIAIPETLKRAGLKQNDLEQIELNEAFASQSVAILKGLDLNPELVNVNGGAIALGHPLGCTGAKLTVQLINEMKEKQKLAVCV